MTMDDHVDCDRQLNEAEDKIEELEAELIETNKQLDNARDCLWGKKADYVKNLEAENKNLKQAINS